MTNERRVLPEVRVCPGWPPRGAWPCPPSPGCTTGSRWWPPPAAGPSPRQSEPGSWRPIRGEYWEDWPMRGEYYLASWLPTITSLPPMASASGNVSLRFNSVLKESRSRDLSWTNQGSVFMSQDVTWTNQRPVFRSHDLSVLDENVELYIRKNIRRCNSIGLLVNEKHELYRSTK